MWGWIVVIFFWGLLINLIGHFTETPFWFAMGSIMMALAVIAAAIFGTHEFLVWSQAWGFEPK